VWVGGNECDDCMHMDMERIQRHVDTGHLWRAQSLGFGINMKWNWDM